MSALKVVLAGARGHGAWHLRNVRRLAERGLVELVGVCDTMPLTSGELEGFDGVRQDTDLAALLDATGAQLAILCTPIPTHAELALTAARRGVHLLLEKPPAASFADFRRIQDGVREAGVACQIGFQSLGSRAVPAIRALLAAGELGEVTGIGAAGNWCRDEAYWQRARWAGRRRLDGVDVIDGVLTNPLAHALATALALDGSTLAEDVAGVETELFHAYGIEADDTSCLRLTTARGRRITVAATLCAERTAEPYVMVHCTRGRVTLYYREDLVLLQRPGCGPEEIHYGRTDLLENLVEHLTDGTELLVPPERAGAFMRALEVIRLAPAPTQLPASAWRFAPDGRRVVPGIDALTAESAERLALYSELGADWARSSSPGALRTEAVRAEQTEVEAR
ncbi:Gfo/Idh/MocA family protein [Streptomyces mesophilus]|uniref:Gfo/Idh/MocA family protein n=1 Tax=Streptomyces mesophilus TaxID=1775132 RepID=UPI0033327ACA